jgi:hypothetical protein
MYKYISRRCKKEVKRPSRIYLVRSYKLCAYYVLRLAELSASDCKKLVCRLCKKALCCDLTREEGYGEVRTDLLSYEELVLWLCACKRIEIR